MLSEPVKADRKNVVLIQVHLYTLWNTFPVAKVLWLFLCVRVVYIEEVGFSEICKLSAYATCAEYLHVSLGITTLHNISTSIK